MVEQITDKPAAGRTGAKKGRPSKYSQALAERICVLLAEGMSLARICRLEGMPDKTTVLRWAMDPKHDFYNRYERARALQIHSLVDEIPDIADDGSNDFMEKLNDAGDVTDYAVNHENINRSKVRIQSRQWLAEKILRQKFGQKVDVTAKHSFAPADMFADAADSAGEDGQAKGGHA